MFQVVVENLLTRMPPTTKSASLVFITWQAKNRHTNYHEVSVISKLKGSHEHSLAAYTYQTVKRDGVVVLILTSLQTSNQSSGNARRQSANWKLLIWGGRLSVWICLETSGLQKQHPVHSACCIPASGRYERDILDHAKLVCTFSQPLQMLSPKALCKCMHECFTEALTRTVAGFTKSRLIFFRASFKQKLCDTNSIDLSVWSSFGPFCICTAVANGLSVLAFADSKPSHCKWIPNDSKPLLNWFGGMPSAPIFLYRPSTKTGVSLGGKSCTAGIEKTEPWPCPSNFALRSIDCVRFRVQALFSHHPYRKQVLLAWGCAWKPFAASRCLIALGSEANHTLPSGGNVGEIALEVTGVWTNLESICLRRQQSQLRLLDSIIFHTIPWVRAAM